jgi:CHAD domain-containing protein
MTSTPGSGPLGPVERLHATASPAAPETAELRIADPAESDEPVRFDSADRRLKRHDVSLERLVRAGTPVWKLVLPRGEVVEAEETAPAHPPPETAALLRSLLGDEPLVPVPWHGDDADFARLQAQILEQRHALLKHDPGTRLGHDPENLHQFRVAGRRLRAFLRVARRLVDDDWAALLRRELGDLGRAAGPVRDLDVLLENLRDEVTRLDAGEQAAGSALLASLEARRDELLDELRRALDDAGYLDLLERLALPIAPAPEPPKVSLHQLAARELIRLVRDVKRLSASPDDASMHALRIRVKRARYMVELVGEPEQRGSGRVIKAAKTLQDLLGEYQDTVVAERVLGELAASEARTPVAFVAGRLAERQRARREGLRQHLPAAWKQLRRGARKLR